MSRDYIYWCRANDGQSFNFKTNTFLEVGIPVIDDNGKKGIIVAVDSLPHSSTFGINEGDRGI